MCKSAFDNCFCIIMRSKLLSSLYDGDAISNGDDVNVHFLRGEISNNIHLKN